MSTVQPASTTKSTKAAPRSPNYPYVDLQRAVELAGKFYEKYKTHSTPEKLAAECWGYSAKSSGTQRVVGALVDYGLVTVKQNAAPLGRELAITENARKVILKAEGYEAILANMAISPPIYGDLWQKYGAEIPPESLIQQYLIFTKKFNDDSAKHVSGSFKRTVAYANPSKMNKFEDMAEEEEGENESAASSSGNFAKIDDSGSTQTEKGKGAPPSKPNMVDTQEMKFPLSKGREAILYVPKGMTGKDFELLSGYLKLAENASLANEEDPES